MRIRFWSAVAGLLAAFPLTAQAQSSTGNLSDIVPNLLLKGITLAGTGDPSTHAGHFTLGDPRFGGSQAGSIANVGAIAAIEAFSDRFKSQVANFPLGSSTGGLTYLYDAQAGTLSRRASSFGPAFAERAATIGRGRYSFGVNLQHMTFDTFGGENLGDRSITFYLPHTDCCTAAAPPPSPLAPGFEGDIAEAALQLKATSTTFMFFANVGVTDRLDVGVAIPVSRVSLEASVRATIIRLSTAGSPLVHTFVAGQDVSELTIENSGTATGVGDIVLRSKYNVVSRGTMGVSAGLDLRLPTGDADDLLGVGTTQAKLLLIVSGGTERVAPHANVGVTFSGSGDRDVDFVFEPLGASDEVNYAAGVEFVATPRLTLLGDIIGRTLLDAGTLESEQLTFQYREGSTTPATAPLLTSSTNPLTGQPYRQLALSSGHLNVLLGAVGFKYNLRNTDVLLAGNLLFPLNNAGLRDRLAFSVGVDFAF